MADKACPRACLAADAVRMAGADCVRLVWLSSKDEQAPYADAWHRVAVQALPGQLACTRVGRSPSTSLRPGKQAQRCMRCPRQT